MNKVVRGSALIDDYGGVTFTPYDSNPAENSPWTLLAIAEKGKLQCSKKKVNLVITIDRPANAQEIMSQMQRNFAKLIGSLVEARTIKRYEKTAEK